MAKSTDAPEPVRPLPSWVPAGWYPDPLGQGKARHWDGKRWTLEYRDSPPPDPVPTSQSEVPAASAPPSAPSGASYGAQQGLRERWSEASKGVQIIVVGVGLIVLIAIIGSIAGGGKNTKTTASSEPTAAAAAAEQKPATPPLALKVDTGDYSLVSSHTTLHGTVTAGATVKVGEQPAHVHGTHWSTTVPLSIGSNAEEVTATMAGHESTSRTVTVTRHHTQAELEAKARATREREQYEQEVNERREREEQKEHEVENASVSRQNALKAAEKYLEISSFSKAGLIEQLSSEAGDKYPEQDAIWGVEHLQGVSWDEQAAKAAKKYLEISSFSCQGLVEQLSSESGDKYTQSQAEYGARQAGIC